MKFHPVIACIDRGCRLETAREVSFDTPQEAREFAKRWSQTGVKLYAGWRVAGMNYRKWEALGDAECTRIMNLCGGFYL